MSSLGYIEKSYGKSINIAVANTYSYNVLSSSNLPDNTIIISSPINENNDDTGTYSLLITDYKGQPVRLTYTLQEGNGMMYLDDSIKVEIDNDTIIEKNGELSVNVNNIIDNDTFIYSDKLYINVDNLDKADENVSGIFKIDEDTIKETNGKLYVNTSNLAYANNSTNIGGIFIGDNKYINVDQGVISINQEAINHASKDNYGLIKGNDNTIDIHDGVVSVITKNLSKCEANNPGIVMPDNISIALNHENELTINTQNLNKATSEKYGVFKFDPATFTIDKDILKIKNYNNFNNIINNINLNKNELEKNIDDVKYLLEQYEVGNSKPEIIDFHSTKLLTTVLERPYYVNPPLTNDELEMNFISAEFMISTNCPFILSIKYEDNVEIPVKLYSINYNNVKIYKGNSGLSEIFQTTESLAVPIKFTFLARNYYKNDKNEYSTETKITITVSYPNDVLINKSIMYSIVRFNSGYNEEIEYDETNIESYI